MFRKMSVAILSLALIAMPLISFGAASLAGPFNQQFFNASGKICSGCKLYFYTTGTSTAKDTWTDSGQVTTNSNPITLNSRGESSSGIFMNGTYRVKLTTSSGTTIWQRDGITGLSDAALTATLSRWQDSGLTPTYVSGTSFTTLGDNTAALVAGRRVQIVVGAGTVYGRITSSTFGGGITTTVVVLDSGALDTGISAVSVSLETPTNTSISWDMMSSGTSAANLTSSGSHTWSGTQTITGGIVSSGTNTISGTQVISGNISSSGTNTLTGATQIDLSTITTGTIGTANITTGTIGTANLTTVTKTGTTKVTNLNADLFENLHGATAGTGDTVCLRDSNGDITGRRFTSTISTGTSPFAVTSTTKVTNLGADTVDTFSASQTPAVNTIPVRDSNGDVLGMAGTGITHRRLNNASWTALLDKSDGPAQYTVGPTGSGASVIFSQMDSIPAGAKYVVLTVALQTYHSSDASTPCKSGATFVYNDANNYVYGYVEAPAYVSSELSTDSSIVLVPLDANRIFKITWTTTTTTNSTHTLSAIVSGYYL